MTIYFLSDGEYIKIGYTKQDVYSRINSLQTANARELKKMVLFILYLFPTKKLLLLV